MRANTATEATDARALAIIENPPVGILEVLKNVTDTNPQVLKYLRGYELMGTAPSILCPLDPVIESIVQRAGGYKDRTMNTAFQSTKTRMLKRLIHAAALAKAFQQGGNVRQKLLALLALPSARLAPILGLTDQLAWRRGKPFKEKQKSVLGEVRKMSDDDLRFRRPDQTAAAGTGAAARAPVEGAVVSSDPALVELTAACKSLATSVHDMGDYLKVLAEDTNKNFAATNKHLKDLAEDTLVVRHTSATKIQARWRSHTAQMNLLEYIAATRIQAQFRSFIAREQFTEYIAATRIQAQLRSFIAREQFTVQRSAMKIQSVWRSYSAQVHVLISIVNVIVIQVSVLVRFLLTVDTFHKFQHSFLCLLFQWSTESLAKTCRPETVQTAPS